MFSLSFIAAVLVIITIFLPAVTTKAGNTYSIYSNGDYYLIIFLSLLGIGASILHEVEVAYFLVELAVVISFYQLNTIFSALQRYSTVIPRRLPLVILLLVAISPILYNNCLLFSF